MLQKLFSHQFSENIWRILPNAEPGSDLWAIELRDPSEKKLSFAVADVSKAKLLWQGSPEGTDWWTSLTAFSYTELFLHNYRYPEVPEPTDLLAVSGSEGTLHWALSNHILVETIDQNTIEVATKAGDQFKYLRCDVKTGTLSNAGVEGGPSLERIILKEPVRYKEDNIYFKKMVVFIAKVTGGHQAVSIDYLEKRPFMMFSYYIYERDKLIQYLLIVTDRMELLLHEQLSDGRDGLGQSTMLLNGSTLVYLKNNNEFSSLTLS
jgi:hypothetical protein